VYCRSLAFCHEMATTHVRFPCFIGTIIVAFFMCSLGLSNYVIAVLRKYGNI
jgi:hypothetical protein